MNGQTTTAQQQQYGYGLSLHNNNNQYGLSFEQQNQIRGYNNSPHIHSPHQFVHSPHASRSPHTINSQYGNTSPHRNHRQQQHRITPQNMNPAGFVTFGEQPKRNAIPLVPTIINGQQYLAPPNYHPKQHQNVPIIGPIIADQRGYPIIQHNSNNNNHNNSNNNNNINNNNININNGNDQSKQYRRHFGRQLKDVEEQFGNDQSLQNIPKPPNKKYGAQFLLRVRKVCSVYINSDLICIFI